MAGKGTTPEAVDALLRDGGEIAFLDVREIVPFGAGHPLLATHLPLGRIELDVAALVPRPHTRIVVTDGGDYFQIEVFLFWSLMIDKTTGEILWETRLPAGGYATPSTYMAGGRQFVVIAACGAGKPGTKPGDAFVTFALPNSSSD